MAEQIKPTMKSVKSKKKALDTQNENKESVSCSFAMLKNDGILPILKLKNVAIIECKKSKNITTSLVLYRSFLQSGSCQVSYVPHILGQNDYKSSIKRTVKQVKKYDVAILYVGGDTKNELEEIEQLAKFIKKYCSLIICYHKIGYLLSSTLISCANAIFTCFNKSKEEGSVLHKVILGEVTPYKKVNVSKDEPFAYENMLNTEKSYCDFMGIGLSYANISYTNVELSHYTAKIGEFIKVRFMLTNNSSFNAYEVPQLYVYTASENLPRLIDCSRVDIKIDESVVVEYVIDTAKLDYSDVDNSGLYSFVACVGKSAEDAIRVPFRVMF